MITLLGAATGAGIAALILPLIASRAYNGEPPILLTAGVYAGLILIGALILFIFSRAITGWLLKQSAALMKRWDEVPSQQALSAAIGMVLGLVVAALLTQLWLSAGSSMLAITFSAIVYVLLGYIGLQTGYRKYRSFWRVDKMIRRRFGHRDEPIARIEEELGLDGGEDAPIAEDAAIPVKLLDTSALIDGRVYDVYKAGFIEGVIIVPAFVMSELQHIADSADDMKRARGRRGLDMLGRLTKLAGDALVIDQSDDPEQGEVDIKLLKLAKARGGTVITNDYNLTKVANVSGIRTLNINELANAVKPILMAGEELRVLIVKEGKELGQGVGYLDDGTMIVVEGGRAYVGQQKNVVVATVLQTSAGRMIFAKLREDGE